MSPKTVARRREMFTRLVQLQDAGVGVDESRQQVAAEFGVRLIVVHSAEEMGLAEDWPIPDVE